MPASKPRLALRRLVPPAAVALVLAAPALVVADDSPLPKAPAPEWKGEAAAAGGGRFALLLIADTQAADASLALAEGPRAVERLTGALGQGLGIAGDRLRVLRGEHVTDAGVEREIKRLADQVRGPDNLLLVYYVGHAWTRGGALELFTYDTHREGDLFERTLPYARLTQHLASLRQGVADQKGALRVVSVIDACRPRTKAPPGPAKYTPTELDVELFAASDGQLASEGVFVEALCEALMDQARGERTVLGDVLDQAARVVKDRTGGAQAPQLARGDRALVLRQQADLSLGVEAWDPVGKRALPGAKVTFAGREGASPASFTGLRPGRYAWQVDAPGHAWRTGEVELTRERSGQTLRVALLPDLALVTGELVNPSGTVVRVRLTGARPEGTIDGYHALEAAVTGSGPFALRLPRLPDAGADGGEVVVEAGGGELARLQVALGASDYVVQDDLRAPRRHLGRIDLGERAKARRLDDVAAPRVQGAIECPRLELTDDKARVAYEQMVEKPVARGGLAELRKALGAANALGERVQPGSLPAYAELRARLTLEVARGRRTGEAEAARNDLVLALGVDGVALGVGQSAAAAREQAVRWLVEDGRAAVEADDAVGAALLDRAHGLADGDLKAVVRLERERAWTRRAEVAVAAALRDDSWALARTVLARAEQRAGAGPLAGVRATIEREGIPRAARDLLARAHEAYADGRLEEAERLYEQAKPACNAHYAGVVTRQLDDLGTRLFQRYLALADERSAAGDLKAVASHLRRAERYDPALVGAMLDELPAEAFPAPEVVLEAPPEDTLLGPAVRVTGRVSATLRRGERLEVTVNGEVVTLGADGAFGAALRLPDGEQPLVVAATVRAAKGARESRVARRVRVDAAPPLLRSVAPRDGVTVKVAALEVQAEVEDASPWVEVTLACEGATSTTRFERGQRVRVRVDLAKGENALSLAAVDAFGNRAPEVRWTVKREMPLPDWWARVFLARRPALPLRKGFAFGEGEGEYVHQRTGLVFVWVPPGAFRMGNTYFHPKNETPDHDVRLAKGFWLAKHEVTWGQYQAFCKATSREPPTRQYSQDDSHPVVNVTWEDAKAFCAWAGLRLPSEAEWEYAARGTDGRAYPWGNFAPDERHCNASGKEDRFQVTAPVGSFPAGASPFGALDMAGNASEWVEDGFHDTYEGAPADGAAWQPTRSGREPVVRVMRGGCCWTNAVDCGARTRSGRRQDEAGGSLGFRPACDP